MFISGKAQEKIPKTKAWCVGIASLTGSLFQDKVVKGRKSQLLKQH